MKVINGEHALSGQLSGLRGHNIPAFAHSDQGTLAEPWRLEFQPWACDPGIATGVGATMAWDDRHKW